MDQNSRFLLKMFRRYYKENEMPMPSRFGRREFGFMYFDRDFMQRHMSFSNPTEMRRFMIAQVPKHSYYSTAYYRRPNAPTMEEKGWMGADLIFDLDADHLEGAEDMSYSQMMDQIKKEMINLLDSFLYNDLGFFRSSMISSATCWITSPPAVTTRVSMNCHRARHPISGSKMSG